jgi:lipopolysaccharide transport system permease protein
VNQSLTSQKQNSPPSDLPENTAITAALAGSETEIVIKSSAAWFDLDFLNLWAYRELLYFLALRDIKLRYKQTFLGIAWVLLQPVATTLIFTIIFTRIGQTEAAGVAYALFAFSGFALWTFIGSAVTSASNSLINNTSLVTKTFFPRLLVPIAAITAHLLDLLLGLLALTAAMLYFPVALSWRILLAPLFVLQILILTVGVGILLAALNVRFRDIKQLLPFALQLWLFLTPVFYSLELLPEKLVWIWKLNPLTGALEAFRASLFGRDFDAAGIAVSAALTIFVFALALFVFRQMEDSFADVI